MPYRGVDIPGDLPSLGTDLGQGLGLFEAARSDGEHHLDRTDDEAHREMVLLGQQAA
ncbi:Sec-independent protein translocase subunit TatA/TatB [Streptomyces echinatus]|uniref:Uncharacterized protein n=1 Tax=Streptomyces echinatus TaxID=67293 RepID=A0A7W9PZS1_9ACTN|nr:hypothetical protein [Streptomyces echinatus]MBB5930654.1 hypothetical protein [Streptomyces echinatus]